MVPPPPAPLIVEIEELLADVSEVSMVPIANAVQLQRELVHRGHRQLARRVERVAKCRNALAHPDVALRRAVLEAFSHVALASKDLARTDGPSVSTDCATDLNSCCAVKGIGLPTLAPTTAQAQQPENAFTRHADHMEEQFKLNGERMASLETRVAAVEAQIAESREVEVLGRVTAAEHAIQEVTERIYKCKQELEHVRWYDGGRIEGKRLCLGDAVKFQAKRLEEVTARLEVQLGCIEAQPVEHSDGSDSASEAGDGDEDSELGDMHVSEQCASTQDEGSRCDGHKRPHSM